MTRVEEFVAGTALGAAFIALIGLDPLVDCDHHIRVEGEWQCKEVE